ncbi:MlaA family lipoprotein, partial [Neisseria sp. P0019.S002]
MKKTTASLCLLISLASAPALAERNPADPYEGYSRTVSKFNDKADKYVLSPV